MNQESVLQTTALQISEMEERLRQAMLKSDISELDVLIAPELIFTSHLGQLVTKLQDLAMHRAGVLKLRALTPSEQQIQLHAGCSIVSVKMHLLGTYEDTEIDIQIRYTRVWAISSTGCLQIVAGHAGIVL